MMSWAGVGTLLGTSLAGFCSSPQAGGWPIALPLLTFLVVVLVGAPCCCCRLVVGVVATLACQGCAPVQAATQAAAGAAVAVAKPALRRLLVLYG